VDENNIITNIAVIDSLKHTITKISIVRKFVQKYYSNTKLF